MKWLFFIFLTGVVLVMLVGGVSYFFYKATEAPSVESAPYAIQTYSQDGMMVPSRVYYASEIRIQDGYPVIKTYWKLDGERYKKQNGEKTLPTNSRIIRREQ